MSDKTLLELRNVDFSYESDASVLNLLMGTNMQVMKGETISLMGRSGSGKSTLMNILAGILMPQSGKVLWRGRDVTKINELERVNLRRGTIGVVYQFHHLLSEFSAIENIMLPVMLNGSSQRRSRKRAIELLQSVSLQDRSEHRPGELSGGERQRVAIARAMAANPAVLLMDEPTGNLDEQTADQVLDMLMTITQSSETSLVIITHDRRVGFQADRSLILRHGQLESFALA